MEVVLTHEIHGFPEAPESAGAGGFCTYVEAYVRLFLVAHLDGASCGFGGERVVASQQLEPQRALGNPLVQDISELITGRIIA